MNCSLLQHMMAQSTLVLLAALLITTLYCCSAENVYCVTPTNTSCSSCPQNSTHCATLSEYAQEAELYLPGTSLGIVPVAILLQSMHYAELVSCSFHDNLGTAVVVNNTNITLAGNAKFAHTRSCIVTLQEVLEELSWLSIAS